MMCLLLNITERTSLEEWVNTVIVLRSPMTHEVMSESYKVFPNTNLSRIISRWRKVGGYEWEDWMVEIGEEEG